MRIIWKDKPRGKGHTNKKYTGFDIIRKNGGWITSVPGDTNVYRTVDHAKNSIDLYLYGYIPKRASYRKKYRYWNNRNNRIDKEEADSNILKEKHSCQISFSFYQHFFMLLQKILVSTLLYSITFSFQIIQFQDTLSEPSC